MKKFLFITLLLYLYSACFAQLKHTITFSDDSTVCFIGTLGIGTYKITQSTTLNHIEDLTNSFKREPVLELQEGFLTYTWQEGSFSLTAVSLGDQGAGIYTFGTCLNTNEDINQLKSLNLRLIMGIAQTLRVNILIK